MRLNRRVPNGTHGGVRGRGYSGPSYSIFYSLQARQLLFLCVELLLRDHAGVEQDLELLQLVGGACTGRSGLGGSCRHAVNDRLFAENEETLY